VTEQEKFLKYLAPTSPQPVLIEVATAKGCIITNTNGKAYYDLIAGIGVVSVGHNNNVVKQAIVNQLDKHAHVMVYGEYIQTPVNSLAARLANLLPTELSTSYLVNSGTEANEGAIKLAKRVTGRFRVIAFNDGYHGNTQGSMSISGNEARKRSYRPLIPGVTFIRFNELDDLQQIDRDIAAVIIEPIQGDAGVIIPSSTFMHALRNRCTATGAQLIFDEVQTGIGRTGKMFAFEHYNIVPDILTLAKGLGGGLPIGAFISSYDKMQLLAEKPMLGHITTFGGNPVTSAAADAVLGIVSQADFLAEVESKGALLEELLSHPAVRQIRRKGLMLAIELDNEEQVNRAVQLARNAGVLIYWFLSTRHSFRISPPLTITEDEIRKSCDILLKVFDKI
jgi:acetylornithine/N-succinyldiaminopimelate aminotransferase